MQTKRPFAMSIAGFDPSGGAGLLADIKTMEQLKVQGLGICTAMTLQTELQFFNLQWRPITEIVLEIDVLMKSYPIEAVKIGVVKNVGYLNEIITRIKLNNSETKIVWDPVLKSTSEFSFFDLNTISQLRSPLKQIDLTTPNYDEYKVLQENHLFKNLEKQCSVLIKGGHRKDKLGTDILIQNRKEISIEPNDTVSDFYPKHGSGCVLSSAIVSHLAKGENLETACRKGKQYIEQFLTSNSSLLGFHS
ncbi:hydroxymethylpyrimidine/phosphomethylpyrimidine kinase [Chryseobacterium sp. Y16C]|uniref:hydroxymethylpyrimidine/phosphomethylpyrimidine kinase n=1 Tax=Chryseobacterium sp. Y16C TaxID=2920939 RepID=UPI001F0A6EC5|nr:hydroxymethylpyrimidine/phosphomethylpyrimidine kinase [Chryseobacterium sp. Y16C]UMQ40968.1 hydroxymethylpyrimidine/phosphomethylpyrimidine kinase [Chryseobacterium sp. Y16C]